MRVLGTRQGIPKGWFNGFRDSLRVVATSGAILLGGGIPATVQAAQQDDTVHWRGDKAKIATPERDVPQRTYELTTTADLRDGRPKGGRVSIQELPNQMTVRSGHLMFDGLFALALQEVRQNSVSHVSDPSFPTKQCECFKTGLKWPYVWTRDTGYSAHLALAAVDPQRTRNSLAFKLSERRDTGELQIVQDTGSGGSWPISTDRVVWILGAYETVKFLGGEARQSFSDRLYTAAVHTLAADEKAAFDPITGLFQGETSFLDWREQTYAPWTADDTVHIGAAKALSTNVLYYKAYRIAATLAEERGDDERQRHYEQKARNLKAAINEHLWLPDADLYASVTGPDYDPAPVRRFDLLGESLAVLFGVADGERARSILSSYPFTEAGPPVVWPQQPDVPIYHNRGIWPFVTTYALKAAANARHAAAADRSLQSLVRGAALNLSNMENFEFLTLSNLFRDGGLSGPVINSQRQLWSVAGYISAVTDVIFGMHAHRGSLRFEPFVTASMRQEYFSASGSVELRDLPYRGERLTVALSFPEETPAVDTEYYTAASYTLNGREISGAITKQMLAGAEDNRLVVQLKAVSSPQDTTVPVYSAEDPHNLTAAERRALFSPRTPRIDRIDVNEGRFVVSWSLHAKKEDLRFRVYQNGKPVASGLNNRRWQAPEGSAEDSACFSVAAYYPETGNESHRSEPYCKWQSDDIKRYSVSADNMGARPPYGVSDQHGRSHYPDWGRPSDVLRLQDVSVEKNGIYMFHMIYGNRGPITTGVTAAVKEVVVRDVQTGESVASGAVSMPHLRRWDIWGHSTGLEVPLEAGRSYEFVISDAFNMSYLKHFEHYRGPGSEKGRVNRANISGIRLRRRPDASR